MAEYRVPQINRVFITGNLTQDPDLRYTPDGQAVCNFQIASNRRYLDKKTNEWKDATTFVRVTTWRQTAERMGEVLHKGSAVYVEGSLQWRSWDTQDGQKRSVVEIQAYRVQHLNKPTEVVETSAPEASKEPSHDVETTPEKEETGEDKGDLPF